MTRPAYYNEIEPYVAEHLRRLIAAGHIAPGDVDERSILDVSPDDLRGYTQCHFFAGVGVWSYALRLAGWPDDRPVWTGSCPCQPFSVAGLGGGMDDQRHLWPYWHFLIQERRPPSVFGEQVEAAIKHGWLDLVQSDLEGSGYAFGSSGIPAAGVGAPHIRQRLFFVADALQSGRPERWPFAGDGQASRRGCADGVAHPAGAGSQGRRPTGQRTDPQRAATERGGGLVQLGDPASERCGETGQSGSGHPQRAADASAASGTGPTNGFWRDADWLFCRDGKWRPVEPGTFPLAHGASSRVGRLRAYGNAIVAQAAAEFISAFMECSA